MYWVVKNSGELSQSRKEDNTLSASKATMENSVIAGIRKFMWTWVGMRRNEAVGLSKQFEH